ncbi:hypothetical protein SAMN05216311_107259 [Chitinophaga sp. CF418]|nr:hypothetical protein SAMN05216311_107259 [Chitinophaga sp. CF418]
MTKAISFYAEKILPVYRTALLSAKNELHAASSGPKASQHNLDLADICAALFEFDSAMYFIRRELAHKDISGNGDLTYYKMLFLFMKNPTTYKTFTDSVYFGRYNIDKAFGHKRFVRSELCMQYIERQLLRGPVYFGWGFDYNYNSINITKEETRLLSVTLRQLADSLKKHLWETGSGEHIGKVRLPQYSKDGTVPVSAVSTNIRELIPDKTTEIETLLEKRELPTDLCYWVDDHLLRQGKPQRYGTHTRTENEKTVVQSPHDTISEIVARRKLVGLNTLQEMIKDREKELKEREELQDDPKH